MSEEAVAELETTETATTETEAPSLDAETTSEKIEATTGVEKTEAEIEAEKQQNQQFALRRVTAKQAKEIRAQKQEISDLQQKASETKVPVADDYENYDDFIQASIDHGIKKGQPRTEYNPIDDYAQELTASGNQKYKDFEQKAWASKEMLPILEEFDNAADIAYYLGENPQDAQRISGMSAVGMAREFTKIEVEVNKPKPRTTNAPAPIKPVDEGATNVADVTKMSMAEYAAYRNKQEYG